MKTKVTNGNAGRAGRTRNGDREGITLTVLAVFFMITLGLFYLSQL